MAKTPEITDVLYSISQVNALTGVPKSTIRFWEKEFQNYLTPLRTAGNQRRYDTEMVSTIETISQLVNSEGYTLDGARRKMIGETEAAPEGKPHKQLDGLAQTMSDYLLKKLFDSMNGEKQQPAEFIIKN
ncbi:MAG: MerR family transcriptional regulator [Calditrichaeota bacterium]|nr:MerR family transcriptional regulator [Calditrichota bacterium]